MRNWDIGILGWPKPNVFYCAYVVIFPFFHHSRHSNQVIVLNNLARNDNDLPGAYARNLLVMNGHEVNAYPANRNFDQITISTENLADGEYLVLLKVNGKPVDHVKLTVNK